MHVPVSKDVFSFLVSGIVGKKDEPHSSIVVRRISSSLNFSKSLDITSTVPTQNEWSLLWIWLVHVLASKLKGVSIVTVDLDLVTGTCSAHKVAQVFEIGPLHSALIFEARSL